MSDIKNLWQSQDREDTVIALTDIQGRSGKFRGRIRWRNILVGGYSLLALAVFARFFVKLSQMPVIPEKNAAMVPIIALMAAAHAWVIFALWWRGRARPLPGELAGEAALDFHRRELEYQRAAAASAWAWYILPFLPGSILSYWYVVKYVPALAAMPRFNFIFLYGGFCLLWFGMIWLAFSRSAGRHELELERLKRLRAE